MLHYKKTDPRAIDPVRANPNDAGLDIFALEEVTIRPGEIVKVPTGLHIALKESNVGLFWGKSGRALKGLTILGGCIDGGYRGELSVVVSNINIANTLQWYWHNLTGSDGEEFHKISVAAAEDIITIPYGKAITQLLVVSGVEFPVPTLLESSHWDETYNNTVRGEKGFGSSDHIRFIDGPLAECTSTQTPKAVIYEKGHRYVRGEGNQYRYDPSIGIR